MSISTSISRYVLVFITVCSAIKGDIAGPVPNTLAGKRKGSVHGNRDIGYEGSPGRDQRVHGVSGVLVAVRTTGTAVYNDLILVVQGGHLLLPYRLRWCQAIVIGNGPS